MCNREHRPFLCGKNTQSAEQLWSWAVKYAAMSKDTTQATLAFQHNKEVSSQPFRKSNRPSRRKPETDEPSDPAARPPWEVPKTVN